MEELVQRIGPYLQIVDAEGRRHSFMANASYVGVSDTDCLRNESIVYIGNRVVPVLRPYDEIMSALLMDVRVRAGPKGPR